MHFSRKTREEDKVKQRGREREKINYFIATRKKILFIRIACTSIWPTIQDKQQQQQPKWEERFDFSFFYNRFSSSAFRLGVINRFESNGYFVAQDCRSFLFSSLLVLNICKWCCFSFAVNNCSGNNRHTHQIGIHFGTMGTKTRVDEWNYQRCFGHGNFMAIWFCKSAILSILFHRFSCHCRYWCCCCCWYFPFFLIIFSMMRQLSSASVLYAAEQ